MAKRRRLPEWRIYYSDGSVVRGRNRVRWDRAPRVGVQAVVLMVPPPLERRRWRKVDDRQIWTGDDEYQLRPGWPVLEGELIPDPDYDRIWRRAFYEE